MLRVIVECHWYIEIKSVLFHTVTSFKAKPQFQIFCKPVATLQVKLVYNSFSLGVSHIEWVENRTDTEVALVLLSEALGNPV
ncbi:Uncharacterised protein [Segatella copri]|nr:Uncharacterised protein [Segatella copri]